MDRWSMPGFDFPLIVAGGGVTMNVMPEEVFLRRQVELNQGGGEDGPSLNENKHDEKFLNTLHVGAQMYSC